MFGYRGLNHADPFGLCPDACVLEGTAATGLGLYIAGVAAIATVAAIANGEEVGAALTAGADAARAKVGAIVEWASNKQQVSHINGKLENINTHFAKLAGNGPPGSGDPDDPKNRKKWKDDIQRSVRQIREHIEKVNGDRNKAPLQKAVDEVEKRLTNTP